MKRAILIILTTSFLLFVLPMIWLIRDSKADEALFQGDSDYQELQIDATDQLILDARLKYYWDEVYQGTSTIGHKAIMQAHVN